MITKMTTTGTVNSYIIRIGGVSVTVNNNFSEKTSDIQVEAKSKGGALDAQA